jgi:magnesium-transporting ATPase (P-type)
MIDLTFLCSRIAASSISLTIQTKTWVIPTVQSIHILCIAIVMSSVAMMNLRLAGFIGREQPVQQMAKRFMPWVWWTLPVMLLTGLIMITGEPERELLNRFFWYKMISLAVVVLLTIPLTRLLEDQPFRQLPYSKRQTARALALLSLFLWLGIIFCGRWIAYA